MNIKRIIAGLAVTPLVAAFALPLTAFAADPVVVRESDVARQAENTPPTKNWVIYTRAAGMATFRNGPSTPPLGSGSLELNTPTGADKITAFNYDQTGTELADVDAVGYSTYRSAGSAQQVAALNVEVDVNGSAQGGFTTLVFEPVYNTDQGAVVNDTWQAWDAYKDGDAIWWSSNPIPSAPNRDTFVSWNTIKAANPAAVIVGGFGVNQGSGNGGLVTSVDALTINDTTYNFEEPVQPTGEITSPEEGSHVRGTVVLGATYNDGDALDDDAVQWALRSSCNDNTTTVAGNVDGKNTPSNWDGSTFTASVDTSTLAPGEYCFVFNPTDDAGQNNVRETRTFFVDANAPYNKDECKQDGWKDFTSPKFKNQGDCVSFMASNGKAKGNPTPDTPVMANNPRF